MVISFRLRETFAGSAAGDKTGQTLARSMPENCLWNQRFPASRRTPPHV
jgi:hypothetical protein